MRPTSKLHLRVASIAIVAVFTATAASCASGARASTPEAPQTAQPRPVVDLQAHRGGRGEWPENTLAAFESAIDLGVTTLEADLAVTADGVVVISHDPYLSPNLVKDAGGSFVTSEPRIYIRELTLAELRLYAVGEINRATSYGRRYPDQQSVPGQEIPTLSALFELATASGSDVRFNIEIKTYPPFPEYTIDYREFARLVVETVDRYNMRSRVTIQSFDWRSLEEVASLAPDIAIACLTVSQFSVDGESYNLQPGRAGGSQWLAGLDVDNYSGVAELVAAFGGDVLSPYYREISAREVEKAHELGLDVIPWTVNDSPDMFLLLDYGVDGIITDYPDELLRFVQAR